MRVFLSNRAASTVSIVFPSSHIADLERSGYPSREVCGISYNSVFNHLDRQQSIPQAAWGAFFGQNITNRPDHPE
ncbi:hypothetical protein THICB2_810030 [Thiomonas sp. CB2]|jgi:hypothetical protein|nr:hypothetical protein THICB2_810030 [Thiomonas sp. CB2]